MPPADASNRVVNSGRSHAVFAGEPLKCGSAGSIPLPDGAHGVFRQYTAAKSLASRLPTLSNLISGVVHVRTQKQVSWVNATGVVAMVANQVGVIENRILIVKNKAKPVSFPQFGTNSQVCMPECGYGTGPFPTLFWSALVDKSPKACDEIYIHEPTPRGSSPGRVAATPGFFARLS